MKLLGSQFRTAVTACSIAATFSLMAAGGGYWLSLRPADRHDQAPITFTVAPGERPSVIASRLDDAGLIRSSTAFVIYITLTGRRTKLQVGTYAIQPAFSTGHIARMLADGEVDMAKLSVPEGFRLNQIAAAAETAGVKGFQTALEGNYGYDFLESRPAGQGLEGYLFPDTYLVARGTAGDSAVRLMLDGFKNRVSPELRQQLQKNGQLTLHQAITLASIIEREAGRPEDMPQISQVFLKRLRIGMKLDSDVTVQYASGLEPSQIAETATAIQNLISPYNTYKVAGLPPGPICSPGLDAMKAVITPAETDYLYFVADRDGMTHFAKTFDEHQANIRQYR